MPRSDPAVRFVRALLAEGGVARCRADGRFALTRAGRTVTLEAARVVELIGAGVLGGDGKSCAVGPGARTWLRRALSEAEPFAGQHRLEAPGPEGARLNLAESPLARLAAGGPAAFLAPHQVEAGERIRRLTERAQLRPRLTTRYAPAYGVTAGPDAAEISDVAADARRRLDACLAALPADCAGVVLDVCGLLKGLQQVESERGWPRRSAKLVLRIGLEQAAAHFGLSPMATGAGWGARAWLDAGARPDKFG